MGRYWKISCPYCKAEIAQGQGYGDTIPKVWLPFIRCMICGNLIQTGGKEFLTMPIEKRAQLSKSKKNSEFIEKSLDRTNNEDYLAFLYKEGYVLYPVTDADRERFINVRFDRYLNCQPSAAATQVLYNVGILLEDDMMDKETGEIKKEILDKNEQNYRMSQNQLALSVVIGFAVGLFFTIFFSSINPNSIFLIFLGIVMGVGAAFGAASIMDHCYGNKKQADVKRSSDHIAEEKTDVSKTLRRIEEEKNSEAAVSSVEEQLATSDRIESKATMGFDKENVPSRVCVIKRLQIALLSFVCGFILLCIIYPISVNVFYNNSIPGKSTSRTVHLSRLDANQTVYCEVDGNYNYLYVKNIDKIVVYKFNNYGYSTSSKLKSYFGSNIHSGKPPLSFVAPAAVPLGIIVVALMIGVILVISCFIHRYSEDELFYLTKRDTDFVDLKNDFKNENINKYDYRKKLRTLFSDKILANKKMFKIFKILY